jgi:NAD(P)-dependent dehydrogenase (short-subunit alcohol dehydrogenase family)
MARHAALAAAAAPAAASLFAVMDANPSLYFYDMLFATQRRRLNYFGGQRIWVTAASSGIGAQLAQELAASGANLVLSSRSPHTLEKVAGKCRQRHPNGHVAQVVPFDVSGVPQEQLERAVDSVLRNGQELDCVILNAGILDNYHLPCKPLQKLLNS